MANVGEPSDDDNEVERVPASRRGDRRLARLQVLAASAFLGVFSAVLGLMAWTSMGHRQLPPLEVDGFERAKRLWHSREPLDYDITVEVVGRQAAVYHVEVRAGEVVVSTRNSLPLKQRRTRGTWSVPGMFNTMQSDVDNAEQHRLGTAAPGVPQVKLRALFDLQLGYPQRYHRTELHRFGNNDVVSWEVKHFAEVSSEKPLAVVPAETSKAKAGTLK